MNQGRLIGIILMLIGLGITILAGLFLAVQVSSEELSAGGAVLGAALAFIVVAPLIGFGYFFYMKGGDEAEEVSQMRKQRDLLDILRSRGQYGINEMAIELGVNVDTVHELIHQLVGLQVFSGYVNWEDGMLYSTDASMLREMKNCQKCGAPIELVGKGMVQCQYCGTEYFLP